MLNIPAKFQPLLLHLFSYILLLCLAIHNIWLMLVDQTNLQLYIWSAPADVSDTFPIQPRSGQLQLELIISYGEIWYDTGEAFS